MHEATSSDVYSFSSDSRGEREGAAVQMQANIRDDSGEGRYEGHGLTHNVFITDISDFENPSIDYQFFGSSGIVIDGNTVTAEGLFDRCPDRRDRGDPGNAGSELRNGQPAVSSR